MTNKEKYLKVFMEIFNVSSEDAVNLKYQGIAAWDSVGHMDLITELEDAFDIAMSTDDIIDLSSFEKGKEILENNYNISFVV